MKATLTKKQKARAKRAAIFEIEDIMGSGIARTRDDVLYPEDPVWAEYLRLLKLALKTVRGAP